MTYPVFSSPDCFPRPYFHLQDILRGYSVVYNTHPVISRKSILRRLHNSRSRSLSTVESVSSQSSSSSDNSSLKNQERVFRLSPSTSDLSGELKHDENHGQAPTLLAPTPIRLTEIKT